MAATYYLIKFIPRRLISRFIGLLAFWKGPRFITQWMIASFASHFKINLQEAEFPYDQYRTMGDFFIRNLKAGVRPLSNASYLHPCDSLLAEHGVIRGDRILQIKEMEYSLSEFIGEANAAEKWQNGFYLTYYLAPSDYHHFHAPVDGKIKSIKYFPGDLWPVNNMGLKFVSSLFVKNERVVIEIESGLGERILMVAVGALNVGSIKLSFFKEFTTNKCNSQKIFKEQIQENTRSDSSSESQIDVRSEANLNMNLGMISKSTSGKKNNNFLYKFPTPISIKKGGELGHFEFGSTVVMLYPPSMAKANSDKLNHIISQPVKVNTKLLPLNADR